MKIASRSLPHLQRSQLVLYHQRKGLEITLPPWAKTAGQSSIAQMGEAVNWRDSLCELLQFRPQAYMSQVQFANQVSLSRSSLLMQSTDDGEITNFMGACYNTGRYFLH